VVRLFTTEDMIRLMNSTMVRMLSLYFIRQVSINDNICYKFCVNNALS